MRKQVLIILGLLLAVLGVGIYFSFTLEETVLFDPPTLWAVLAAAVLGLIFGAIRAKRKAKESIEGGEVVRHSAGAFIEHWATALGIFVLITSGILLGLYFFTISYNTLSDGALLPISAVGSLGAAFFALNLHFVGVVVTLFGGSYFAADYLVSRNYSRLLPSFRDIFGGFFGKYMLRRKWTAETKYLSSQKAAFLAWAVLGIVVLVTGVIKLVWRAWPVQSSVLEVTTIIHDIVSLLFVLMLIVHILFVLGLRAHWPSLKSWITGKVPEKYAKEEHPLWYEELKKGP